MVDANDRKVFFSVLTVLLHCTSLSDGERFVSGENHTSTVCNAAVSCAGSQSLAQKGYYYDSRLRSCVELTSNCSVVAKAVFTSAEDCERVCVKTIGGCSSTQLGCCEDGVTPVAADGNCDVDEDSSENGRGSTPWQLIVAVGVCSLVIAMAVIGLMFIGAYASRRKHVQQRRCISEALKMYESASDDSDTSFEDDPVNKNLFDRL